MSAEAASGSDKIPSSAAGDQPQDAAIYGMTRPVFVLINCFIVLWFSLFTVHAMPWGLLRQRLEAVLKPYTEELTRYNQHWGMFTAFSRDFNEHGQSFITFADGSIKLYEWPRNDIKDQFHKWQHGKTREVWIDQLLNEPATNPFEPAVAKYMARANLFANNQPTRVSLGANWHRIPPMTQPTRFEDLPQQHWHYTLYVYKVTEDDLKP